MRGFNRRSAGQNLYLPIRSVSLGKAAQRSEEYDAIMLRMINLRPFYATFREEEDQRTLCPHVIGYKRKSAGETPRYESVLCFQIEPVDEEGWRCFNIADLTIVDVDDEDEHPDPSSWHTPEDYSNSEHQNCVQKVKYSVPEP
jgi:hypothetical protein